VALALLRRLFLLHLAGKQDFNMAEDVCCNGCGVRRKQDACDLIHGGYWPMTPKQPTTYLCVRMMEAWGAWETTAPQLAAGAFPRGINGLSKRFGGDGSLKVGGWVV
jgi:hypothetical protein